ncbi:hypothetical protein VB779_02780 [Haloarculaceae archaeon H-GB11]|nr:hypothetical protein [Haloarculaceae archaeon H-GB11]
MKRPVLVALIVVSLFGTPMAVSGRLVDPHFEATVPEPTLTPGETQNVTIQVRNVADEADDTTRRAKRVVGYVNAGDSNLTVDSGPRLLGTVDNDEVKAVTVTVTVPENVSAGTYRLPITLDYVVEETDHIDRVMATVRVDPRPRLRIVDVRSDVQVGDRGTASIVVENVGERTATGGKLRLVSNDDTLSVGGETAASRYLGPLAPGQRKTRTYVVSASNAARPQRYALNVTATYENQDGVLVRQRVGTARVIPVRNQTFDARTTNTSLRVGEDGVVRVGVTNTGPKPIRDATVLLETPSESVELEERAVRVGNLTVGADASASFPATVASSAEPGPRQFAATVRYRTANGTKRVSDDLYLNGTVAPSRDRVRLDPVATTVGIDTDARITVDIENVWNRRLTAVTATAAASPPFESESPQAFVDELPVGESETIAFGLTVSEDAVPTTTSIPVNVSAETPDGERVSLGTHYVPVTVTEDTATQSAMVTLALGSIIVLVILGIGAWWLRR